VIAGREMPRDGLGFVLADGAREPSIGLNLRRDEQARAATQFRDAHRRFHADHIRDFAQHAGQSAGRNRRV
jgi:hypothetical protein